MRRHVRGHHPGHRGPGCELIVLFLTEAPEIIEDLRAAVAAGDQIRVTVAVHRLSTQGAHLGATPVLELCRLFENRPVPADPAVLAERLAAAVAETCAALRRLLAAGSGQT